MRGLVLGLGSIGRRHARCFKAAGLDSVDGFDPSPERRKEFEDECGGHTFADQDEALSSQPDIVIVASPNVFHPKQVKAAFEKNLPVMVEKPLATRVEDGEDVLHYIQKHGGYLHMGSNWKFHPAFQGMKEWLDNGEIGQVTGGQVIAGGYLPDWHPYEDYRHMYTSRLDLGGGAVFDTHELDYLMWMLGPIKSLAGSIAHSGVLEIETEDVAAAILRFESGALVTLLTDYIQRVGQRRYLISGSLGTIEWDIADGHLRLHRPNERNAVVRDLSAVNINDMYVAQARHIIDDIRMNRPAVTPIQQAFTVLKLQDRWRTSNDAPIVSS